MSNTKQNNTHPKKDGTVNPNANAAGQAIDHSKPELVNHKLVDITAIRGKAYGSLCGTDGAFSSMYALNPMITGDVVNALLDFFIVNSDEPHPIEIMKNEPSKTIWQSFFRAYQERGKATDSNTKNPSQSFRNMLSSFPAKAKQVMLALDEAGLKNCWTLQKSSKQPELNEEQIKFIDKFLQLQGVYNSSMDLSSRYKIFKALKGKLPETKEVKQ